MTSSFYTKEQMLREVNSFSQSALVGSGNSKICLLVGSALLEKAMAPHSSTLAWKIPWTEELGGLQSTGRKESDTTERLHFTTHPSDAEQ